MWDMYQLLPGMRTTCSNVTRNFSIGSSKDLFVCRLIFVDVLWFTKQLCVSAFRFFTKDKNGPLFCGSLLWTPIFTRSPKVLPGSKYNFIVVVVQVVFPFEMQLLCQQIARYTVHRIKVGLQFTHCIAVNQSPWRAGNDGTIVPSCSQRKKIFCFLIYYY